jgi:hypothetical protein
MGRRETIVAPIALAAALATACQTVDCDMAYSVDLDAAADGYARAAVALARHDPQLVEDWRGPAEWQRSARQPVAVIADRIRALQRTLAVDWPAADPPASRHRYLQGQLRALDLAARRLLGESTSFDEEVREGLGLTLALPDPAALATAVKEVDTLLPPGETLGSRYAAYRRGFAVPRDRGDAVMHAALDACRQAAEELVSAADGTIELAFVSGISWDATARPLGDDRTRIEINSDVPLDLTRALRLACHEGYPGHHLQHLLMAERDSDRPRPPERWLTPGFGPHVLIAEGAAEAAADIVMPAGRRARVYRDVLAPAAGMAGGRFETLARIEDLAARLELAATPIARNYVDGRISREEAVARLGRETAIDADQFLAFVDRRRARAIAYPEGRRVLGDHLRGPGLAGLRRLFASRPFALQ